MSVLTDAVRLPSANEAVAPVRILDADGHLVCVVSAEEFRRAHPTRFEADRAKKPREGFTHRRIVVDDEDDRVSAVHGLRRFYTGTTN
jgi:hypothetical protein